MLLCMQLRIHNFIHLMTFGTSVFTTILIMLYMREEGTSLLSGGVSGESLFMYEMR